MSDTFEPKIVGFMCNWCSYRAADLAGSARIKYPPNVRIIRTMCSGRFDPMFVFKSLALGADGVMMAGCHPGECHYIDQNYKAMRRYAVIKKMCQMLGIEEQRVQLVWRSAAEGQGLAEFIQQMTEEIRELGPLKWPENGAKTEDRLASLEAIAKGQREAVETY